MDEKFFFDAMQAVGLNVIVFDEETPMPERSAPVRNALYTVRTAPDTYYTVTKFSPDDMEVLEVYYTSEQGCTCPAGHRETCRHREMLTAFLAAGRIDSGWFVTWDIPVWYPPFKTEE